MSSSKKLFVVSSLVAVSVLLLGTTPIEAGYISPVGTVNQSYCSLPTWTIDKSYDGSLGTFAQLICDDPVHIDDHTDIVTGFALYDLGSVQQVDGVKFQAPTASYSAGPKDVQFFTVTSGNMANYVAAGYTTEAQVAASPYITVVGSASFGSWTSESSATASFTQFTGQYAGILISTGYDTPSHKVNSLGEVQFNASPTPEPSTIVLLAIGLIGLLAYAWRKRK